MFTEKRAIHSLKVAQIMQEKALDLGMTKGKADEMFLLGYIHDIGYQFTEYQETHAHTGGIFLKAQKYTYWKEVYDHGNPEVAEWSDELYLLNFADMHIDPCGIFLSYADRLKDIETRYGRESEQYRNARLVVERLCDDKGSQHDR